MTDPRRKYSLDNPFAPHNDEGGVAVEGEYSPDNPFAKKPSSPSDEVSDPETGMTFKISETPSSSRPKNDTPGDIDLRKSVSPKQNPPKKKSRVREAMEEAATMPDPMTGVGTPEVKEPGEFGKGILRGTGALASVTGSATETATGGRVGKTARKVGRALEETAGPPRINRMKDIRGVGDVVDYGARVVGETAPWVGADLAAGAALGPAGVYGMQGVIVSGMIREELEKIGVTDEPTIRKVTAVVGVPAAAAGGALPSLVLRNIIGSAVKRRVAELGVGQVARAVAKHAVTGAAGLAGQQTAIYAGSRAMTGKPIVPQELYDVAGSAAEMGATAGGLMGGATALGAPRAAPKLHPDTPPEVAQRIAESANQRNAEPEKITGAATMVNGNVYTGVIHADAIRAAIEAGDLPKELINGGEMDATHADHGAVDGFVTNKGRFVDRAEAERIANGANQIRPDRGDDGWRQLDGAPGELMAEDLKTDAVSPPKVGELRTMDIFADPSRFQFKSGKDEKTGAGGALKKVDLYREELAGIMTVWRDPVDGKVYVVNGHHRLDLAKRSGTPTVLVRFLTAPSAEAARAQGAIQNIAEGQGTPTDVAKFLRDTGQTLEDLKAQGVPVEGNLAEKGVGLSRLAPDLFQKVATGKLEEAVGVGIGSVTGDADMQRTAVTVISKSGKRLTEKEAADVARQIVADGSENVSQETLFGTEEEHIPLYVEKAQLAGAIQRRLENDKRLFSYVTKGARADELARAGNVIDKERSAQLAEQSAQLGEVFRQLFTRKGAVSDALTEGARRLAHGEKPAAVVESIYEGIRQEIQAAFGGGKGEDLSRNESDAGGHEEEGGTPPVEVDPAQDALFAPGSAWDEVIRKQRDRLYEKLNRANGKAERDAVIAQLKELDKIKRKDPASAVSEDEMAFRARAGETRRSVDAIAGEDVVRTSTDRAQSDIFGGRPERAADTRVDLFAEGLPTAEEVAAEGARQDRLAGERAQQRVNEKLAQQRNAAAETVTFKRKDGSDVTFRVNKNANKRGDTGLVHESGRYIGGDSADNAEIFEQARARYGRTVFVDHRQQATTETVPEPELEAHDEQGAFFSPSERVSNEQLDAGSLPGYDAPVSIPKTAIAIRAKAGLPAAPRPQRALIEISRELADAAGVPLRQGRFNAAMRKAVGVFFPHAETTRVVRYDKVDTVAHEVGHFVSKRHLKNPANKGAAARGAMSLTKSMIAELRMMGHNLYGSRKPAAGYGEEGIAEAFKFYVTDPARLTTEAPEFAAALDAELAKVPALKKALLQAREDFAAHEKSDATARADAMLSVHENTRNWASVSEIVRQAVDDLNPWREAVEEIGGTDDITKHAYVLARLSRGDAGLAEEMNERGVIDFKTRKRVTGGLVPILKSIPKEKMQAFRRYLYAERALELWERNIDVGLTHADATELKKLYEPEFGPQALEVWKHSIALLKYRADAGLLTPEEFKAIGKRNLRRVPMYVVFEEGKDVTKGSGWGKKWGRNSSGIQTIKGSARRKIDPLEGVLQDTYRTVEQANRHNVASTLFKLGLETEGGGRVIEEVERPKQKSAVSVERVMDQLVDLGLVDPSTIRMSDNGTIAIEKPDGSVIDLDASVLEQWDFRKTENATDAKDMVIPTVIDGERKWLQIQDPKLYEALNALGHERLPEWARILGMPARALRAGATLTPEFLGRNPFRDIFTVASYTRSKNLADVVPGVIFAKGFFHMVQKDDVFQRWRVEGGDNAAQLAIDRRELQNHIDHVTRNWHEIARDVVIHPVDVLRMVSAAMENATRVGEFSVVEKSQAKEGKTPRQASVAAAIASRDATLDFGRRGAAAKSMNQIIAFFNANLQGTDKLIQEHRRRPLTVAARALAGITLPSLVLYAMQHDDEDFKKLPRWRRALFWNLIVRDNKGELKHIFSFPKPFELGIIYGTLPEAIAEWWLEHDTKGFGEWARATAQGFTPGMIPTGLLPLLENWGNKSFYTGRKIVPAAAERREPALQSREWTGEFARALGERVNYSPAKIENLVRGWWGGLGGNYALPIANALTRADLKLQGKEPLKRRNPAAEDRLTDIPGVRGFTVRPPTGTDTQQVDDLYEAYQAADAVRQSYKALKDAGRDKDAHQFALDHAEELAAVRSSESSRGAGRLRLAYNRLQDVRKERTEVLQDDELTADEKKRRVRLLDARMVKIAERGLQKTR